MESTKILLVEDDEVLANGITKSLEQLGYSVSHIAHGVQAYDTIRRLTFDLIILDLTLPGLDGSEILRKLKAVANPTPILVLTARNTLQDRIISLDLGADNYMAKPFELIELEARIRALLRRRGKTLVNKTLNEQIIIDATSRNVYAGDKQVTLSDREMELFSILVEKKNQVVLRETLTSQIRGDQQEFSENAIDVYIHRLRKKAVEVGIEVKTIRGLGYMAILKEA